MKTIFFIGNKRSGTSILAKSLNLHPQVHITHESDLLWIAYRLYEFGSIEFYEFDNEVSTRKTMEICKDIINQYRYMTPREFLLKCHQTIMNTGTPWNAATHKLASIIGDKKPSQTIEIISWTHRHFPDSHYLHIIRHPLDFIRSCKRLPPPFDIMSGRSDQERLELWLKNEMMVLEFKKHHHVFSTTFQEFFDRPEPFLNTVFENLGLELIHLDLFWNRRVLKDQFYKLQLDINLSQSVIDVIDEYKLCEE